MNIEDILIQPGDLPSINVPGEMKILFGDDPILQNVGNAERMVIQWIGNIESQAKIGGEVQLYVYPSETLAEKAFIRITQDFHGQLLANVGDIAFIKHTNDFPPMPPATGIRFRRQRYVVEIRGTDNDDPSFAISKLSRESLIRYAQLLDKRLEEAATRN